MMKTINRIASDRAAIFTNNVGEFIADIALCNKSTLKIRLDRIGCIVDGGVDEEIL